MGNVDNPGLVFEQSGDQQVYQAIYEDPQGNAWEISMLGDPEILRPLVERGAIALQAEPIDAAEFAALRERAASLTSEPPGELPEPRLPELSTLIRMIRLAIPVPYRVSFDIDPEVRRGGYQSHGFHLLGTGDTTANVTPNASRGDVKVKLSSNGREAWAQGSGITAELADIGSNVAWHVGVYWRNGTPHAEYSLRGDINVG
jgi:hypothetical protein